MLIIKLEFRRLFTFSARAKTVDFFSAYKLSERDYKKIELLFV